MYLLLGDAADACCQGVKRALSARGFDSRVVPNPMSEPVTLSWRLDTWSSQTRLILEDGTSLASDDLDGVFVRGSSWLASDRWQPTDVDYVVAEVWAGLLGWLWSLPCRVVNRYPPWVWFRPSAPVLAWHPAIRRSGLIPLETLVTNDPLPGHGFGAWPQDGLRYAPLSVAARFVVTERDAPQLQALERHVPLTLTEVPQGTYDGCVVGDRVIWDRSPTTEHTLLEPGLRRLGRDAGLSFLEVSIAQTRGGLRVAGVDGFPRLSAFSATRLRQVVDGLTHLLVVA